MMEKSLVLSVLEETYLKKVSNNEDNEPLLPDDWDELPIDDKIILLDQAIASNCVIETQKEDMKPTK